LAYPELISQIFYIVGNLVVYHIMQIRKRVNLWMVLLVLFVILVVPHIVDGNAFTHSCTPYDDCIIQEFYINSTGEPCIGCEVNITLLYPNQSFIANATFTEQGGGYYTYNAGLLSVVGFYPATIRGYDEDGDLTISNQNIISVARESSRLIFVMIAMFAAAALLMFASFRLDEKEHNLLRWTFFTWSLLLALSALFIMFVDTKNEAFAGITENTFIMFALLVFIFVVMFIIRLTTRWISKIVSERSKE